MAAFNLSTLQLSRSVYYTGPAYFAGEAPTAPDDPDGRFRVLNVPTRGRITVYDRSNMVVAASTLSAPDGTWMVDYLRNDLFYVVVGWDQTGAQNAAIQDWVKPALPE